LDGSPDFIGWYTNRGFKRLDVPPVLYENVAYTPMELPPEAAQQWLAND
jgi:hypothetical protein